MTLSVYCALLAHFFLVYGGLLAANKLSPVQFLRKAKDAILTAFVTRSSGGTLPATMDTADKQIGVSTGVYSFTLPLGATINMDGTVIYQGVCAIFFGLAIGLPLALSQQITVTTTAVLASRGTAGVSGAGMWYHPYLHPCNFVCRGKMKTGFFSFHIRLFLPVLLVAVFLPVLLQAAGPNSPFVRPLVVGGDYSYQPYEFLDENGNPTGFNVELTGRLQR